MNNISNIFLLVQCSLKNNEVEPHPLIPRLFPWTSDNSIIMPAKVFNVPTHNLCQHNRHSYHYIWPMTLLQCYDKIKLYQCSCHHIVLAICSQYVDLSINKLIKDHMKQKFWEWYAVEVRRKLQTTPVNEAQVNVSLSVIKNPSAIWIISGWQALERRPEVAINSFREIWYFEYRWHLACWSYQ